MINLVRGQESIWEGERRNRNLYNTGHMLGMLDAGYMYWEFVILLSISLYLF